MTPETETNSPSMGSNDRDGSDVTTTCASDITGNQVQATGSKDADKEVL